MSFLWHKIVGKECITRPDATERDVWSDSALYSYKAFIQNLNEIEDYYPAILKFEMNRSIWWGWDILSGIIG